jgi:hypothetical protein
MRTLEEATDTRRATQALYQFGPGVREQMRHNDIQRLLRLFKTALLEELRDTSGEQIQTFAAATLARFGADDPVVIECLMEQLRYFRHRSDMTLAEVLKALGALGGSARAAIPMIWELAHDPTSAPYVRRQARTTIEAIQGPTGEGRGGV